MTERIDDLIASPSTYAQPEVFEEVFRDLRENAPVRWTEPEGYRPFWTVSTFEGVRTVERKSAIFTNSPRHMLESVAQEEANRAFSGGDRALKTIVSMDGEEHRLHRAIAKDWFQPESVAKLEQDIAKIATEFVDRLADAGGEADLSRLLFSRYPLRVAMSLFGVPASDEEQVLEIANQFVSPDDPDVAKGRTAAETRVAGAQGFFQYFGELLRDRRKNPRDDLATIIANAEIEGEPMDPRAAVSYCVVIATAGHDTTSFTTSGGMYGLLKRPEILAALRADRSLLPNAIDEMVRWVSPVKSFMRTARADFELQGQQIREGESVLLSFASANRDESVFTDAWDFQLNRPPHPHLAFGAGPHMCLGLHLAKLEMRLLFEELLTRVSDIELAADPLYYRANIVQGIKSLPVRYSMAS